MSLHCLKCGASFAPHQARQFNVYRYRLTSQGVEAASLGLHRSTPLEDVMQSFLNIYSYPFFEKYLQMEIKRALRYKTPFSLVSMTIANLADVESRLGVGGKVSLVKELEEIIGTSIRETDLVSFSPRQEILLLLVGATSERAHSVVQRLLDKSNEVLSIPLQLNFHVACVPDQAQNYTDVKQLLAPGE